MKNLVMLFLLIILCYSISAQTNYEKFCSYFQEADTLNQRVLLEKWYGENPKDAELYTCMFNYYFTQSREEFLTITAGEPDYSEDSLLILSKDDKVAGFIGSQIRYDESNFKKAFESIDKGISLFPNRLDMRFGKIYALGEIEDWRNFTDNIKSTIRYSSTNSNKWSWTLNADYDGGKDAFLSALQDYQMTLYNTMDDSLLVFMREISEEVLTYYPQHIESLSNLSITYLLTNDFEMGLKYLSKAEKISPEDYIILYNMAYAYGQLKNVEKAKEYYNKVIEYGDEQAKIQAKNELEKLK